jgi:undecaprenyl-diphosphatase
MISGYLFRLVTSKLPQYYLRISVNDLIKACILGVVEGLTEFLPVSSTGHLILTGELLALNAGWSETFEVFIQLGAILAVVALYPKRFLGLVPTKGWAETKGSFLGWGGLVRLAITCLPAFVLGALFHSKIKAKLFAPLPVAIALIVGGLILIIVEKRAKKPGCTDINSLSIPVCLGVGLFQCLALWPGMSRSGSTIIGAMLLGVERKTAAEFSFLVAVPVMFAAVGFDLLKSELVFSSEVLTIFAVGFVVSLLTAIAAIRCFVGLLGRWTMVPFGVYRIALGIVILGSLSLLN